MLERIELSRVDLELSRGVVAQREALRLRLHLRTLLLGELLRVHLGPAHATRAGGPRRRLRRALRAAGDRLAVARDRPTRLRARVEGRARRACVGGLDGRCRAEQEHQVLQSDDAAAAAAAAAALGRVEHRLHLALGRAQPQAGGDELGDVGPREGAFLRGVRGVEELRDLSLLRVRVKVRVRVRVRVTRVGYG